MTAIDIEKLTEFMRTHTNREAAKHFGVSQRTISRRLKKHGLTSSILKFGDTTLSEFQKDIIVGSLLGDAHIEKSRFKIGQAFRRKEYVEWIFENLNPFSKNMYEDKAKLGEKTYKFYRMYTSHHEIFRKIRDKWYSDVKNVPLDLKLNDNIFLHWIMQDGTNNQSKKSFRISTNGFQEKEVNFLISILKRDLKIGATRNTEKGKPTIHIGAREYFKVVDILKPKMIWDCFDYKVDTSKIKIKSNEKLGAYKLNYEAAQEIRRLYNKDFTMKKIADLFDVTISTISNIVNNNSYKIKDTASVNVEYKP
tara:strand:- start:490 stop:1413 length:924 start_codon:yes stop_codon:yes gene_type:complete